MIRAAHHRKPGAARRAVSAAVLAVLLAGAVGCSRRGGDGADPPGSTEGPVATAADGFPLPKVEPVQKPALDGVTFAPATSEMTAAAKPVAIAVSSVATQTDLRALRSPSGEAVASISTYLVPPASAASERFRTQFLVQILSAAVGPQEPRFVQIANQTVAESTGQVGAAAWFEGATVRLLVPAPSGGAQDLDALVATALSIPHE